MTFFQRETEDVHSEELSESRRFKKYVFIRSYDENINKFVREHDEHKEKHEMKMENFAAVRRTSIKPVAMKMRVTQELPNLKLVRDC